MRTASEKGWPVMRPMFFEFPEDEICYTLGEQYMFGGDVLFAPIVNRGQTEKDVYLPAGKWIRACTNEPYEPGWHRVRAELGEFIAFVRDGAPVLEVF